MYRKLYSVMTAAALIFALAAGAGAFTGVKAISYTDGERGFNVPTGQANFVGADLADNSPIPTVRDRSADGAKFTPDTYGINSSLRP